MAPHANRYRIITRKQLVSWSVLIFAAVAVTGAVMLKIVQIYLAGLAELATTEPALAAERASNVLQLVFVSTTVFATGIGSFVVWYGYRAIRSSSFPPPGAWVIEGRPIHSGAKARRLGWAQIILGVMMAVVASYAVYHAWAALPLL